MAPRPFWKGYLKLSLVTCPVAMMPALGDEGRVRFRTINRKTGNPVVSRYVDEKSGKVVEDDDQVHGYEHGEDKYVMLEEDEIDAVALESTHTIDIDTFVPADSISAIWRDRPHFLMPDDEVGEEAFCVIREAMAATGMCGIARLVLYRRERAVLLEPRDKGIVVWTLRYGDEVREEDDFFSDIAAVKPEASQKSLMKKLIAAQTMEWDDERIDDPVQEKLLAMIASAKKKKGKRKAESKEAAPETKTGGNVVSIMDALRKSLQQGAGRS